MIHKRASKIITILVTGLLLLTTMSSVTGFVNNKNDINSIVLYDGNDTDISDYETMESENIQDSMISSSFNEETKNVGLLQKIIGNRLSSVLDNLRVNFPRLKSFPALNKIFSIFQQKKIDTYKENNIHNDFPDKTQEDTIISALSEGEEPGDITVLPESGHISLMGEGYMIIDTTIDINGSVLVTLAGSIYMSTGMESIDIWWNLSTGYFEINASSFSEDGDPYFELQDFLIEIRENNTDPDNKIAFYIGSILADASIHIILQENMAEGFISYDGIFEIQDFNVSASGFTYGNFTIAGSFDFSGELGGDLQVSWNETELSLQGGFDASASAILTITDFYLKVDQNLSITAGLDYLCISDGKINLTMGDNLEVAAGATIDLQGFYLNSDFLTATIGSLNTSFGIYVRTDLASNILLGASGALIISDLAAYVQGLGGLSTSYVDTNGSILFEMRNSGDYIHVGASGYVEVCDLDAYMTGVLSIGWQRFYAKGSVSLTSTSTYLSISAAGNITINQFYLSATGLSVSFDYLIASGGFSVYLGSHISVYAGGFISIDKLEVGIAGLYAYIGSIYATGKVGVFIGGHFMVDVEGIVEIRSVFVSGSISMTMGSLSAGVDVYLYVGNEVHATANGYLNINNFEFDGLGGWSTFKLSGDAKGDITGSEISVAGTSEGSDATVTLSITNGHFGILGISHVTGTITLDGGGSAEFGGESNTITFGASASASITGVIFKGFGLDFTLSSMVISGGGSGTIYVGEKMVSVESGTVSLSINGFVMNAPYDITIQSCSIEGGGDLTLQLTSETSVFFSGIGDVTGHVQINDALFQIDFSANVFGNANWADNLHLDVSGSGYLHLHVEKSGGIMLNVILVGSGGTLSVDYSGNFGNEGQVQASTGGWDASIVLSKRDEEYSLSLSGDVYVSYTIGSTDGNMFLSTGGGCLVEVGVKKGGSPKLLLNADVPAGGGGIVNVVYRGSSLPPDFCMVDLGLDAVISFTTSRLKGSIGPGSAYLRWDKYADLGDRLTISGECAGSLFWNSGEWVQVWPWPWIEGEVSLEAKGPEGSWSKSVSVDLGDTVTFKATVNQDGENNNGNEQSGGSTNLYASFASENSGTGYTYDFFWDDATPGTTVTSDESCYENHDYNEIGSYTAEVMVYDSADMLIGMDHVTIQVGDPLGVSLKCDKPILKLYSFGEMATFTATVDNGESNSGSATEGQSSDNQGGTTYTSYASGGFKYDYEFDFGGWDIRGATTVRTSCAMSDECDTAGEKTVTVTVTEKYVDTGEETGRVGSASCIIHILNGIKVILIPSKLFPECGEEMSFTAKILKDDSEEESGSSSESESTTQEQNSNNFGTLKYDPGDEKYSYNFNFGDGDTKSESSDSKQVTVNHKYIVNGPKLVEVCVKNTETGSEGKAYAVVEVWGGLDVTLSASPKTPDKNASVKFTATVDENSGSNSESTESQNTNQESNVYTTFSSSGDSYSYVFEFDDGSSPDTKSGVSPLSTFHIYENPGIYMAKVTVTGDGGVSGVATTLVYVGGNGSIDISPEILDFGTLSTGETKTKSFKVKNNAENGSLDWHVSGRPNWAKCTPLNGSALGGSEDFDIVSVTVIAPSGGNGNAESNTPESTESNNANVNDIVMNFVSYNQMSLDFGSIQETESTTNSQTSPTPTTGGTNTYDGRIQVSNDKDDSDKDSVYVIFKVPKSSAVADSGMDMTIDATEAQSVDVVYNMVPSNYITAEGEVVAVDDSYSVIANPDGTYDIQQDNQIVQEGVESVQNYFTNNDAQTGTTDIPEDDDGNNEPSLSCPSSKSVTEGNSCSFTASASDQDGNSLSITATKISGPGSVSTSSGSTNYASYAIDEGQTTTSYASKTVTYHSSEDSDCEDGTAKIRVKVTDGHGGSTSKTVTININDDDSCGDDCCFPAGTLITMADESFKAIEDVKAGEYVLSYNTKDSELTTCKVLETVSPMRKGVYSINNGLICPTDDHPFYTSKADGRIGWAAIDPIHSISGYKMQVMSLEVGDKIFNSDGQWIKIESIEYQPGMIQTYNLEDVSGKSNFFANGILVHNAADCDDSDSDSSSSSSGSGTNYMFSSSYSEPDEEPRESTGEIEEVIDIAVQFDASGSYISTNSQVNNDVNDEYDDSTSGISNDNNEPNYIGEAIPYEEFSFSQYTLSFLDLGGEKATTPVEETSFSLFKKSNVVYNLLELLVEKFPILGKIRFIREMLKDNQVSLDEDIDDDSLIVTEPDDNDATQILPEEEMPDDSPIIIHPDNDDQISSDEEVHNVPFSDVANEELTYIWDFGDGDVGYGINPIHTYHIAYSYSSEIKDTFTNGFAPVGIPDETDYISDDTTLIDEPYEIDEVVDIDQVSSSGSVIKETFAYTITLIIVDESGDLLSFDRTTVSVEIPIPTQNQASSSQDDADDSYGDLHYKNIENIAFGDVVLSKTDLLQNPSSLSNDLVGAEVSSTLHNPAIEVVNYLVIEFEFEQSQIAKDDETFDSSSYILFDPLVIGDDPVMPADDSSSSVDSDDTPETDIPALRVTTNQPIFVNGEFVSASEIKEGDILYTFLGKNAIVISVTEQSGYVDIYNIGLKEHHSYFANGILVKSLDVPNSGSSQGFLGDTKIIMADEATENYDVSKDEGSGIVDRIPDDNVIEFLTHLSF